MRWDAVGGAGVGVCVGGGGDASLRSSPSSHLERDSKTRRTLAGHYWGWYSEVAWEIH